MPRTGRTVIPGYMYHLTHRGNNKQQLFYNELDYRRYLFWFEEISRKYGLNLAAYCLMPNHVHFIAKADNKVSFAKTINVAHANYARYFHNEHQTVGHVWQGRYYSCLLEAAHLLAAIRYVERNPVRAWLASKPWDWIWSSARSHVSDERGIVTLVDKEFVGVTDWVKYIALSDKEEDLHEIRMQTNANKAWGSEGFKKEIGEQFKIELMIKVGGRPKKQENLTTSPVSDDKVLTWNLPANREPF